MYRNFLEDSEKMYEISYVVSNFEIKYICGEFWCTLHAKMIGEHRETIAHYEEVLDTPAKIIKAFEAKEDVTKLGFDKLLIKVIEIKPPDITHIIIED